jgi:hypothetical protein
MQMLETKDPCEAQRCRRAQYTGYPLEVTVSGSQVFGIVRSVKQQLGPLWVVTISPTEPKVYQRPRHKPVNG